MKRLIGILLMVGMIASFAAAGGQGEAVGAPAEDAKANFTFIVKDMTNPYWWRMREGAERAAKELEVNFTWLAAQFNGDIEGQIGIVESQLALGPDALILVPMNGTALCPKVAEANEKGIPVINPDTRLTCDSGDAVSFVGLDERQSAITMAEFLVEYYDGQAKLALLEGFRGSSTAEERLVGFNEVFDAHPGMEVVASQTADWDREKGLNVTENILQAHPDLDLIVASNDEMALGAIQAVKSAGLNEQVMITGVDAIPAGLQAIKDGELLATIDGNTDKVGYEAVAAAYQYVVEGTTDLPDWIKVPSAVILEDGVTAEYLEGRGIELQ